MKKASRLLAIAAALGILSFSATGCTDKTTVTLHEPGVYKGEIDPLLSRQSDPNYEEALQKRFAKGQTDR